MDLWDSPQDPDCESRGSVNKFMGDFASATHAKNPQGDDAKLLQKI